MSFKLFFLDRDLSVTELDRLARERNAAPAFPKGISKLVVSNAGTMSLANVGDKMEVLGAGAQHSVTKAD